MNREIHLPKLMHAGRQRGETVFLGRLMQRVGQGNIEMTGEVNHVKRVLRFGLFDFSVSSGRFATSAANWVELHAQPFPVAVQQGTGERWAIERSVGNRVRCW